MPAASAAPVTTGNQRPSLACTRQKECCPGCARYGQRGPDEETEMNFMPVGQCPAIKATRTARWCQRRKVCFQVPMHFAADALSACLCGSPLPCFRRTGFSRKLQTEIAAKIRKHNFWNYCDHFVAHVYSREPQCAPPRRRQRHVSDAGCFGAAALQGSLATASGRRQARLQKFGVVEVSETWHIGRAHHGL